MTFNHLVLIGGGHTNALLMKKWFMKPKLMPDLPVSIISKDSHLVYSAMFPSVISKSITLKDSLIDISAIAKSANVSFIKAEVNNIEFLNKKILLNKRSSINYSKLVLNCGSATKCGSEFENLLKNKIAFTIKPFFSCYEILKSEDSFNSSEELPFAVVGSGLAAIEVIFALRKRWSSRRLVLVCNINKVDKLFIKSLRESNIHFSDNLNFKYKKVLLCTGNQPLTWIRDNILDLDIKGRILVNKNLKVNNFDEIFAVGDCSFLDSRQTCSSGIYAVKAVDRLAKNIKNDFLEKKLIPWKPQKKGLQIINSYKGDIPYAFLFYGIIKLGPSYLFWVLKNIIDKNFVRKLNVPIMNSDKKKGLKNNIDCRGCASKLSKRLLNEALINSQLNDFVDYPEDASIIYKNKNEIILQSIDGFPAIVSDPWLNARISTLHACSDLWSCGAQLSSAQVLISLPKVESEFQKYLFSQSLESIKSTVEELGGKILGGHTFETRNYVEKPYSLGLDVSLSVQGILNNGMKPWKISGMKSGDILLMSRPLGVGIFFAAHMRNISLYKSYDQIFRNLLTSQQYLIDQINKTQLKIGHQFIHAATDITGFGLIGHLKEMIDASNSLKLEKNIKQVKVLLNLGSFKAYSGIFNLINYGIRSSLFDANIEIFNLINSQKHKDRILLFSDENKYSEDKLKEIIALLVDPQTCGPLLISCNKRYEKYLSNDWYKIGEVI